MLQTPHKPSSLERLFRGVLALSLTGSRKLVSLARRLASCLGWAVLLFVDFQFLVLCFVVFGALALTQVEGLLIRWADGRVEYQ